MKKTCGFRLKNGFNIGEFIGKSDLDFVFSIKNINPNQYLLLNQEAFGTFDEDTVNGFIEAGKKVAIINSNTLNMDVYNAPEEEMTSVIINMN